MNDLYKKYWLILAFVLILASAILVVVLNNKTFTNTAKDTLATRVITLQNTTTSADLSTRLEGNATGIYYPLYSLSEL
ncbi:MAG: hypothetical protein KGL95_04070, partial [Patescibacteria group bacterium]|nr:hypothetical protein [Patescibacteria group bacterium]